MTRYIHRSQVLHHNRVLGGVCSCGNPDGGRCEPWCGQECGRCGEFHTGRCEQFTQCCGAETPCRDCPEVRHAA